MPLMVGIYRGVHLPYASLVGIYRGVPYPMPPWCVYTGVYILLVCPAITRFTGGLGMGPGGLSASLSLSER